MKRNYLYPANIFSVQNVSPVALVLILSCLAACARPAPPPPPFGIDCPASESRVCWTNGTMESDCLRDFLAQADPDRSRPAPELDRKLAQALDMFERGEPAQALPMIRKYADQGNAEALCALGRARELGLGTAVDSARAEESYRAAMARDSAEAAGRLGLMGLLGTAPGIGQDQAMDLIRQAAGLGRGDFLFLLAELNARPGSFFNIPDRVFCYLVRAGACRDPWAMFYVGILYEYSLQDPKTAVVWYWRAADLGHSRAAAALARLYEKGSGLPRDDAQALAWYLVAANNRPPRVGTDRAWYINDIDVGRDHYVPPALARLYLHGEGVPPDVHKAAFWAARTLLEHRTSANDLLPEIQAALPPGEWERIQAEAKSWRPNPSPLVKPRLAERLFEAKVLEKGPAQ